jgi:hypothetical protein
MSCKVPSSFRLKLASHWSRWWRRYRQQRILPHSFAVCASKTESTTGDRATLNDLNHKEFSSLQSRWLVYATYEKRICEWFTVYWVSSRSPTSKADDDKHVSSPRMCDRIAGGLPCDVGVPLAVHTVYDLQRRNISFLFYSGSCKVECSTLHLTITQQINRTQDLHQQLLINANSKHFYSVKLLWSCIVFINTLI